MDVTGVERIAAERMRQVEAKGYTAEHDDQHTDGTILRAALAYAQEAYALETGYILWSSHWLWKPSPDPIRNLEKAGALIAAEIDRLQRLKQADAAEG